MAYKGNIIWRSQNFIANQLVSKEEILGKYFIGLTVEGHSRIFTMKIKESGDLSDRPVVFESAAEASHFVDWLYFPKDSLSVLEVTEDLYNRDVFPTQGAYLIKISRIQLY